MRGLGVVRMCVRDKGDRWPTERDATTAQNQNTPANERTRPKKNPPNSQVNSFYVAVAFDFVVRQTEHGFRGLASGLFLCVGGVA